MRIAIFGGTFDPIHKGHLQIARHVARVLRLDQVLFVTSAHPPHKTSQRLSSPFDRMAMVVLALRGEKRFIPSTVELDSTAGKNYSIDTVKKIRRSLKSEDELFFLIGADQFAEFQTWRSVKELLRKVAFVVVSRPGLDFRRLLQQAAPQLRAVVKWLKPSGGGNLVSSKVVRSALPVIFLLPGLKIGISSTVIRARIAAGKSVHRWLDPEVIEYIRKRRLYQKTPIV